MKCDIYQSKKNARLFVIVPKNLLISKYLPDIGKEFIINKKWKTVVLNEKENNLLIALNSKEALINIKRQGYHIQEISTNFKENVLKQ